MVSLRTRNSPLLKFQAAAEALSGGKTLAELASIYKVHPTEISRWKKVLSEEGPKLFKKKGSKATQDTERQLLDQQLVIGKLLV